MLLLALLACDPVADKPADGGADSSTDSPTDVHADGYADPLVHGPEAKMGTLACVTCHGDDLTGGTSAVSCDSCHQEGWRTDCTRCHGGSESDGGAPPVGIDDGTTDTSFGAHTAHVTENPITVALDCTSCHQKPTDVLSAGHVFVSDTTPGAAEAIFTSSLSSSATWDGAGTCSNVYCHGSGQGHDGTVTVGSFEPSCDGCHPFRDSGSALWSTMSGQHDRHLSLPTDAEGAYECGDCHKGVVEVWEPIQDKSLHLDGAVTVAPVGGMRWDPTAKTCTGTCHEEEHAGRSWTGEGAR